MNARAVVTGALMGIALATPAFSQEEMKGMAAPPAVIKEWAKGNACKALKDLRGHAVLIEFFATW